jgi:hypothetical protein
MSESEPPPGKKVKQSTLGSFFRLGRPAAASAMTTAADSMDTLDSQHQNVARPASAPSNQHQQDLVRSTVASADAAHIGSPEATAAGQNCFDIGLGIGSELSIEAKLALLERPWTPEETYKFPEIAQGNRNRHFNRGWFNKRPWLAYTKMYGEGALCVYCILFGRSVQAPQGGVLAAGAFCMRPFKRYKDAIHAMNTHETSAIHRLAAEFARNFKQCSTNPEMHILNKISAEREKQVLQNRRRLRGPIEAVIFLCRQGLSLRGHRS